MLVVLLLHSNRFHKHLYGLNGNRLVAAAVRKYGLTHFAFLVVETVPGIVSLEDNKDLLDMENHYIKLLRPEYNIAAEAGNTIGVKHSPETFGSNATKLLIRTARTNRSFKPRNYS